MREAASLRRNLLRFLLTVGPGALWLFAFVLLPSVLVLIASLMSRGSFGQLAPPLGLHNYVRFFTEPLFLGDPGQEPVDRLLGHGADRAAGLPTGLLYRPAPPQTVPAAAGDHPLFHQLLDPGVRLDRAVAARRGGERGDYRLRPAACGAFPLELCGLSRHRLHLFAFFSCCPSTQRWSGSSGTSWRPPTT